MVFSLFVCGCGKESSSPDFDFMDGYLATWDRFAQGENELVPQIKRDTPRFLEELTEALTQGDKRAPSRMVFYAVVQVGGSVPYESVAGRAFEQMTGGNVPVFTSKEGERVYFASDLYMWWRRHRSEFEAFPLFEEWEQRDFAREVVIPKYESFEREK